MLPVFGLDQAIFSAVLMAIAVVGCLALEPAATPYVAGAGLLGMWFVARPHAPVSARLPSSSKGAIIEILDERWRRSGLQDCWVPRSARWRRWGYVRICLAEQPGILVVTGPETNIRPLLAAARQAVD